MPDADASRSIREALNLHALASVRHRTAVGRLLRLSENEVLAVLHLRRAGRLTPTALGGLLSLTSGGTTALVQRLERDGHVVRGRHPGDGRSTLLTLSVRTSERIDEALAPLERAIDARVAALPAEQRSVVAGFLADVAAATDEHADRAALAAGELAWPPFDHPVPSLSL